MVLATENMLPERTVLLSRLTGARPEEPAECVLADYRAAMARADKIIATRRFDEAPERTEQWWDQAGLAFPDLRSIVVHVLVETSVHAGHLDAVRELLDGRQHLVV